MYTHTHTHTHVHNYTDGQIQQQDIRVSQITDKTHTNTHTHTHILAPNDLYHVRQTFFRPKHTYSLELGGLDSIARGLANLPCQSYDQFFTKQITNHLFSERPPFGPSMDLVSLNIQRGRDHGIGSEYSKHHHRSSAEEFAIKRNNVAKGCPENKIKSG